MELVSEGEADTDLRSSSERDTPPPSSLEVLVELDKAVDEPEPLRGGAYVSARQSNL